MKEKRQQFPIGLRTIKTAVAATIAMLIVNTYGTSSSKMVFAMLGAMAAMEPTFRGSLRACLTQIVGVIFGCIVGTLLILLPVHPFLAAVAGIIMVITLYNLFPISFSPSLPCLIVVLLCTTPDIDPFYYAAVRCWDSAIGLGVGMLVNLLIFPYDNSRQIRETVESLDKEILLFLGEMFDGDDLLPDTEKMAQMIDSLAKQLKIFTDQKFLFRQKTYDKERDSFRICEGKARQLIAQMEVLCGMETPGNLDEENRKLLNDCGAFMREDRPPAKENEVDVVTNYHIRQILVLRKELMEALGK